MNRSPIINAMSDIIRQTWGDKKLNDGDVELLHILLNIAVDNQNTQKPAQTQSVEEMIDVTTVEWAKARKERLRKWQIAKDNNLFGAQLDPNGRLSANQEETVENFLLSQTEPTDPAKRFIVVGVQSSPNKGGHRTWTTLWLRSSQDWCGNSGHWHLTSVEDEAYTFDKYETALSAIKATGGNHLRVVPIPD